MAGRSGLIAALAFAAGWLLAKYLDSAPVTTIIVCFFSAAVAAIAVDTLARLETESREIHGSLQDIESRIDSFDRFFPSAQSRAGLLALDERLRQLESFALFFESDNLRVAQATGQNGARQLGDDLRHAVDDLRRHLEAIRPTLPT